MYGKRLFQLASLAGFAVTAGVDGSRDQASLEQKMAASGALIYRQARNRYELDSLPRIAVTILSGTITQPAAS